MATLIVSAVFHDLTRHQSIVTVRWEDDAERRLGLVVPFGCTFEDAKAEAQKALKALAQEIETADIRSD